MLGQSNFEEIHGERNVLNKSVYIPIQTKTYAHGLNPIFEIPDWDNPIAKNRTTIFLKKDKDTDYHSLISKTIKLIAFINFDIYNLESYDFGKCKNRYKRQTR